MKIFIESQKFNQPLVIVGLSLAFIVVGVSTYTNWVAISEGSITDKISALSGFLIISLVCVFFLYSKLKTRIDEKGVHYQFFPFQFKYTTINWNLIDNCYVRNYDAISEYGGWGLKFSFFRNKGKSFTTKGNVGLQIELKNGKKVLIGTQKKEDLQRTLDTYKDKVDNNSK